MKKIIFFVFLFFTTLASSQVYHFKSEQNGKSIIHRLMLDENYLVETQFSSQPAEFILTRGGFYSEKEGVFEVELEFNSNYESDGQKELKISKDSTWEEVSKERLDLNGKWLMAGRMTDEGERRRDTTGPRKTMKFLNNGYFQWIAFNTESFQFFGSGGGFYTTDQGNYTEHIEFFSRDNKSVGRILPFQYSLKGTDWHHQGKSSKGVPMHEIWAKRDR
ncbi:MAG: hypothetical protein ACO39G_03180 [Flavobacteriaceae bacterium]